MGKALSALLAVLGVLAAVGGSVLVVIVLKMVHDRVKPRHETLVQRYIEIAGQITALVVGIFAVTMIMQGTAVGVERILQSLGV